MSLGTVACNPQMARYRAEKARGVQMRAQQAEDAATGLPSLPSPEYNAALTRFRQDEAVYRRNPDAFMVPGAPLECALAAEFEAELWVSFVKPMDLEVGQTFNDPSSQPFRVYHGQCEGGHLTGPAVLGLFYTDFFGHTMQKLIVATFDSWPLTGDVVEYWSYVVAGIPSIRTADSAQVEFGYSHMEAGSTVRAYRFTVKRDDPSWRSTAVVESVAAGQLEQRYYLGAKQQSTTHFRVAGPHIIPHGPSVGFTEPPGPKILACFDFNRLVGRANCSVSMPVTEEYPKDGGLIDGDPSRQPSVTIWKPIEKGGYWLVDVEGSAPSTATNVVRSKDSERFAAREATRHLLLKRDVSNSRPRLEPFSKKVPRAPGESGEGRGVPVFVQPKRAAEPIAGTVASKRAAPELRTNAADSRAASNPSAGSATLPPKGQVDALCAAAAGRQAELYAPGDAKLRKTMTATFKTDCKKSFWSMERITCVLGAGDARGLASCEALPAAEPEIKAGDATACKRAGQNQARLIARSDASLAKTLAASIASSCRSDKWSALRMRCVERSQSAEEAGGCAE